MNITNRLSDQTLIVVIGPSGCGKSTLAHKVSQELNIKFLEGDDFHPQSNLDKMKSSIPLTDSDREEWLNLLINKTSNSSESQVLSCSCLKQKYRDKFDLIPQKVFWVVPYFSREILESRLLNRKGHFFPKELLDSQLQDWEKPSGINVYFQKKGLDFNLAEIL